MKPTILTIAAIGLCLPGVPRLSAQEPQEPPKILVVVREQIKEGRGPAHEKSEAAWAEVQRKGNLSAHYLAMTAESGPSEAWFLEPYNSMAEFEKFDAEAEKSPLKPELDKANAQDAEFRNSTRNIIAAYRGDLSYRAQDGIAGLAKCRHMAVTLLRIRYGRGAELAAAAKLAISGDEKSNSDQPEITYQVISGAPSGTYLIFAPMVSLSHMDSAPERDAASRQAMGEKSWQLFEKTAADIVQSSENFLFSFSPPMSYVSKEFAAGDPEFWMPKPKVAPRPAAKKSGEKKTGAHSPA